MMKVGQMYIKLFFNKLHNQLFFPWNKLHIQFADVRRDHCIGERKTRASLSVQFQPKPSV